jgi:hypothetical protein
MDYDQVYYVDGRNATPRPAVDHRVGIASPAVATIPTSTRVVIPAGPSSAPYQYAAPNLYGPTIYPNTTYPNATLNPSFNWGYPVQPPYIMPPVAGPPSNLATILGGFGDLGTLANIIAQAFAAFLPLPAAPNPQDPSNSEDPSTSAAVNSSNMIRYQSALAMFARRDQQILTLGSVLKELFRRSGSAFGA